MNKIDNYQIISNEKLCLISGGRLHDIPFNLKVLREESGYSRAQLAEKLSIGVSTLSRYESGSRVPDVDTIIEICNLFDTSISNLILKQK